MPPIMRALVAPLVLLLVAAPVAAGPVADATSAVFFSSYQQVRVVGNRAYIASFAGLVIEDVSDPSNPVTLSQLPLDRSGAFKVAVSGNYAYVLSGLFVLEESILRIVDVSDPTAPHVVGEYTDLADARVQGLLAIGTTLVVANGGAVDTIDVSDPTSPTKLASLQVTPDPGQVVGLAANGGIVYAPWQGIDENGVPFNGLTAVDVTTPGAPAALDSFDLGSDTLPYTIANLGAVVYVGQTPSAVVIIDASDPSALAKIGQLEFPMTPQADVFASGDRLFAATENLDAGDMTIRVYDASDPRAPSLLGSTVARCAVAGMDYESALALAYAPCRDETGSGLTIFDVTAAGALAPASSRFVPEIVDVAAGPEDVELAVGSTTLAAVRRTENGGLEVLGKLDLGQRAFRIDVEGGRAYVLTADSSVGRNAHVHVVDVASPAAMVDLGAIDAPGDGYLVTARRFDVSGTTLYLGTPAGLDVYDVADGAHPSKIGSLGLPSVAENVLVEGNTAFVTVLRVVDEVQQFDLYRVSVKRPTRPKIVSKRTGVDRVNYVNDLVLDGDRLYLAVAGNGSPFPIAGDGRLVVVDTSKKKPKLVAKIPSSPTLNGYASGLDLRGSELFVADGLDGISVFTLDGSGMPTFAGAIDTAGFASGVSAADDGRLTVADGSSLRIVTRQE